MSFNKFYYLYSMVTSNNIEIGPDKDTSPKVQDK